MGKIKDKYEKSKTLFKNKVKKVHLTLKMKALIGLVLLGILFLIPGYFDLFNPEFISEYVAQFGIWGPIIFSLIYLVFLFIPFGSTVTTVTAGLLYGPLYGGLFVLFLTVFLSLVPFYVARKLGKSWVERKVREVNVDKYLDKINENSFVILFYLRLIPSVPYEFQNYIAGLTNIRPVKYMLATFLGIFPIIFILTFLGNSLSDIGGQDFWVAVILFLAFLLLPPIYYLIKKYMLKS